MKKWLTPSIVVCCLTLIPVWMGCQTVALPEHINTTFEERQPLITPDGKRIYFSRKGDKRNIGEFDYADCWYAEKDAQGLWMKPIHCGMIINNFEDNALVAIDYGQSRGLVKDAKNPAEFIELKLDGAYVQRTQPLRWLDSLSTIQILDVHLLLEKGIAVLSMRSDEGEDSDLYLSVKSPNDSAWSFPMKIEGGINGPLDERYPHLAPDGRTLYFSSHSHGGFGGSDIFISRLMGQDLSYWTAPRNMGRSINSALDETESSLSVTDKTFYFVRTLPLKGSDLFSVNLESSFMPQPLSLVAITADCQGQLVTSTFEGKTERLPQKDSIFNLVLDGNVASMLTFIENQNKFYPSQIIETSANNKRLDYDQQALIDAVLSDSDYKSAELEIQKIQKEILSNRTSLKDYAQQLVNQIENLSIPKTAVFENEGFKTDRTLLELERRYEQFFDRTLSGKEVQQKDSVPATSMDIDREKRIADLKSQINQQIISDDKYETKEEVRPSFIDFREILKREVEKELFYKVWEALVYDMKSEVQTEVKKEFDPEIYRNILKGDWLKDSIPIFWRVPKGSPVLATFNNELAGDLKRHLEPLVRATMLGLLKDEVFAYLDKIFHMLVLNKIQTVAEDKLKELTSGQKKLEEKIFNSLIEAAEIPLEQDSETLNIEEVESVEYEWLYTSIPLVKHVFFELPALKFSANKIQLDHFARLELNRIVQLLRTMPELKIEILVHTHGYMTYSAADDLTRQRAEQIENYLARAGVISGRVKVVGVGKNYPKLANHNYENRRQNQRVEILIK